MQFKKKFIIICFETIKHSKAQLFKSLLSQIIPQITSENNPLNALPSSLRSPSSSSVGTITSPQSQQEPERPLISHGIIFRETESFSPDESQPSRNSYGADADETHPVWKEEMNLQK